MAADCYRGGCLANNDQVGAAADKNSLEQLQTEGQVSASRFDARAVVARLCKNAEAVVEVARELSCPWTVVYHRTVKKKKKKKKI